MRVKTGTLAECMERDIVSPSVLGETRDAIGSAAARAQSGRRATCPCSAVNIIILDDYQDAVRKLQVRSACWNS